MLSAVEEATEAYIIYDSFGTKLWRKTKAQQDWVMSPGDPNQVDDELIWYHFALIAAAIIELWEERTANDQTCDGISAVDVHNFMLEKAKGCAITMEVLTEMRFAEVALLLHQAEETCDAEKYVTALKLASILITSTHATKYTYIHAKFLVWWQCASEAEKTIFEKVILTKKTKKGKHIFTDRFVEWMVKDMRAVAGKHYRKGTTNKLNRAAILLDEKKTLQDAFKLEKEGDSKNYNQEEERITSSKLGKVFCESLLFCIDSKLWKSTEKTRLSLQEGWPDINPEMISIALIGEDRMDQYIDLHLKGTTDLNDREREIKDSDLLRTIQPTVENQQSDDEKDVERSVSTTLSYVKDKYKLTELRVAYRALRDNWNSDEIQQDFPTKSTAENKDAYTMAICKAREILMCYDASWAANTKKAVEEENKARSASAHDTISERLDLVSNHLFIKLFMSDELRVAYSEKLSFKDSNATQTTTTPMTASGTRRRRTLSCSN